MTTTTTMTTPVQRRLARTITTAPPAPGFGGEGHEAVFVLDPDGFAEQDPFILLADDRLNMPPGAAVGGAHPHAGFEIATFVVQGSIHEGDEGVLHEGDLLWTTARRGITHGERAVPAPATRILQLWFALPPVDRWVEPHFHYLLDGEVQVGDGARLTVGQVGWLDRHDGDDASVVRLTAGADGARMVLYAGQPQHSPIVTHGPFVGGSRVDLMRMSREYVEGRFVRMSDLVRAASGAG